MPADLTSTRSARVTEVRHLYDRRHRAERGAFVVEGPQAVREALGAGVLELYVTEAAAQRYPEFLEQARGGGARVAVATEDVLEAMSETRQPQGVLAICPLVTRPVADVLAGIATSDPLVVVLDRISDPGNAGTIIRTADAMGADAIVLTEGSVDPHNGKCVRSTAGSIFHVPICADVPSADAIQACGVSGLMLVAADAHAPVSLETSHESLRGPLAWVFGSEAHGLHDDWRRAVQMTVRIPMAGRAESLNLAASAAICLYATQRTRSGT
jgi:TrmH family RNA methyltransferase